MRTTDYARRTHLLDYAKDDPGTVTVLILNRGGKPGWELAFG
jgi:hypothetical protein